MRRVEISTMSLSSYVRFSETVDNLGYVCNRIYINSFFENGGHNDT